MKAPKLRLLKVIVQPVFILDDGTHISEINHPPVAIPADEWPTYSSERFPRELKEWQQQLETEHASDSPGADRGLGKPEVEEIEG